MTPLLEHGTVHEFAEICTIPVNDDLTADLALYSYRTPDDDGPGTPHPYTLVLVEVAEVAGFAPRLLCYDRKSGTAGGNTSYFDLINDSDEDSSARPDREIKLDESEAFNKRFKLYAEDGIGSNWLRQLFSPAFMTWMSDSSPVGLGFELTQGALCVFVPRTLTTSEELDQFHKAAIHVIETLRDEALEEEGMREAGRSAMADDQGLTLDSVTARQAATVTWNSPPETVAVASKRYRPLGLKSWRPWVLGPLYFLACLLLGVFFAYGETWEGYLLILASPFVGGSVFMKLVNDRARRVGKAAFAGEYAKAHNLTLEQPRLVQTRNMRLKLPGIPETAMSGLIGQDVEGTLAFAVSREKPRTPFNLLVAETERDIGEPQLAEGQGLSRHESTVAIWAKSAGEQKRSTQEVDEFRKWAAGLIVSAAASDPAAPANTDPEDAGPESAG